MRTISTHTFKHTIKDIHKNTENRKFCFIIGAGASRKSGIPTGGELSEKWFPEIKERLDERELKAWISEQKIDEKDLASSYGSIYRKRFENDKTSGYEFLVQAMKNATPSFGHIVLSQILSCSPGHCVLTTNFDSLVESSVYQFTDKTPLVCGHESLSGYARPSMTHPLVIKIHRDLLMAPKSDPDEINKLDLGWKEPLDHIFSSHIPVIMGYGGNDGSLMSYFEEMNKPSNLFWCGVDEGHVSLRTKSLIEKHDGTFVKIAGFDELMYELLWAFDEIKPIKEKLDEVTSIRIQIAAKQLEEITLSKTIITTSPFKTSLDEQKELSALEYGTMAEKEPDFETRKQIYLKALEKYPTTGWLWVDFTFFLQIEKKDYDKLDHYYQTTLKLNRNNAAVFGNYALYLTHIKRDYSQAEKYFLDALVIEPNDLNNNNNYAAFLLNKKRDFYKAKEYYLKGLNIDPNDAVINGNYANFLMNQEKDYIKAEDYYVKALLIDRNDSIINNNYAIFLKIVKKDYINAERYLLKALSCDPIDPNAYGNYAQMYLEKGKIKEAEEYIRRAFHCEDNDGLLIELWFYRYAHFLEYLAESEKKINELLANGVRSIGWDFAQNIKVAIANNHPNPEKLQEFARRITTE